MLLVGLYLLAEYGAFAILRYRTFATAIYTQYTLGFDAQAASVLTLVLCLIGVILLMGESRRRTLVAPGPRVGPARRARPASAGRRHWPCWRSLTLSRWPSACRWARSSTGWCRAAPPRCRPRRCGGTTVRSLTLGGVAAAVATALALPVAMSRCATPATTSNGVERVAFLDRALPGVAIGLTLVTVAVHHLRPAVPDHDAARGRLRDALLPARPRGGARRGRARPAGARGRGPIAGGVAPARACGASRCRWSSPGWPRPPPWCGCRPPPSSRPPCCCGPPAWRRSPHVLGVHDGPGIRRRRPLRGHHDRRVRAPRPAARPPRPVVVIVIVVAGTPHGVTPTQVDIPHR